MYVSVAQKMPEIWQETWKNKFWQKTYFVKNDDFPLQKPKNHQIDRFTFLTISLIIFELQRRTIPHFNPLNKLIWPLENRIFSKLNPFWVIRQNKVSEFFLVRLYIYFPHSSSNNRMVHYVMLFWCWLRKKNTFKCLYCTRSAK